ncbi:MAG TPA: hypothetical protein VFN55_03025 [Solirubrobacteraceae bacterium]|nr:hypothetical protein [Solirubrobacteraceae bacterium]
MSERPQKINIGFLGGPVLSARVAPDDLKVLRAALGTTGWHDLKAEDGTIALDLEKVVYVLVDNEANRVGFGLS